MFTVNLISAEKSKGRPSGDLHSPINFVRRDGAGVVHVCKIYLRNKHEKKP